MENTTNEEDDMITLHGCGQITYWRFPQNIKQCPKISCLEDFDSRLDAIDHYRQQHAEKAILCTLCNKPISTLQAWNFEDHFRRMHPFKTIPYDFNGGNTSVSEKLQNKIVEVWNCFEEFLTKTKKSAQRSKYLNCFFNRMILLWMM